MTAMRHRSAYFDQIGGKHMGRCLCEVAFQEAPRRLRGASGEDGASGPLPLKVQFS